MPFHKSLIKFLEIRESVLVESLGDKKFAPRFRLEANVLLDHMKISIIPEEELYQTAIHLLSFYRSFMIRYGKLIPETSPAGVGDEKVIIESIFMDAVEDIMAR